MTPNNVALFFPITKHCSDDDWSIMVVDTFKSEEDALMRAKQCIDDTPQGTLLMVHPMGTWIPCTTDSAWYQNLDEVSSKENNNPAMGRHGSVCDIRTRDTSRTAEPANLPAATHTEKETVSTSHHARLQQLLGYEGHTVTDSHQYLELLDQYAMLGAYTRALQNHIDTADTNIGATEQLIADLDTEFPEYREECVTRYKTALAESGIVMDESDRTTVLYHLMRGC